MKRFKKILKWTLITIVTIIAGISITVAMRQNMKYEAPYPEIHASTDTAIIARGKHLVFSSAHCINCHSTKNPDSLLALGQDVPLTGGYVFDLPVGKIYSKNITPDKETGIGNYSDAEIARALRYGVHPNGKAVFDFMPFHNTSDEDLTAIISYLRAQKPVKNKVPDHELNAMGKVINAFLIKPVGPTGEVLKSIKPDTTAAYGKYMAMSVAECYGCHTQRDLAGQFTGKPFTGGNDIDGFITPNLTIDSTGRLFKWSKDDFIKRFRMGKLIPKSPMPWNSYNRMTNDELTSIYNFLQTVPAAKAPEIKN